MKELALMAGSMLGIIPLGLGLWVDRRIGGWLGGLIGFAALLSGYVLIFLILDFISPNPGHWHL